MGDVENVDLLVSVLIVRESFLPLEICTECMFKSVPCRTPLQKIP